MKKGILFRLLVIVLVCAMLFGLMGFTTIEPQDGEDGVQNEVVPEQPTGSQGEEPKGEEPGEEPEPVDDLVQVRIGKADGGTLKLVGELPENAETKEDGTVVFSVEKGTKLTFVAAAAKEGVVSSEFVAAYVDDKTDEAGPVKVVDGTEADGVYTFSVTTGENPITVSAEFFGIKSIEVSKADVWANAEDGGKTITVKTFSAASVAITDAEDAAVEVKSAEDNVFTAFVEKNIGEEGEEFTVVAVNASELSTDPSVVTVKKIDTVAPVVNDLVCQQDKEWVWDGPFKGHNEVWNNWSFTIAEDGSGIDANSLKILNPNKTDSGIKVSYSKGVYSFSTKNNANYLVEVSDIAGNGKNTVGNDIVAPTISGITVNEDHACILDGVIWLSKDGKVTVTAEDASGIAAIILLKDEEEISTVKEKTTATFSITESGEYTIKAVDKADNESSVIYEVRCDITPPTINPSPAQFKVTNTGIGARIVHFLSFGLLCNRELVIQFDASDEGGSGIKQYLYSLDEGESWLDMSGAEHNVCVLPENYKGKLMISVIDNVGNTSTSKVIYKDGDLEIEEISNENAHDDMNESEGILVYAFDEEKNSYSNLVDGKENWAKSITFVVSTAIDQGHKLKSLAVNYDNNKSIDLTFDEDSNSYVGELSDVYQGNVEFVATVITQEAVAAVEATETTEGRDAVPEETVNYSVSIPVNVQNFLNAATVTVNGDKENPLTAGGVYGWYNAQDNVLNEAKINGCAGSMAPYTTNYEISYLTYQDFNAGKGIADAAVQEDGSISGENKSVDSADILSLIKPETSPGIYYIKVWSKDAAGNENVPAVYTIKIDEAQPWITATFSSNENKNIKYYNYQRTVIVNVSDTSFDANDSFLDQFNVVFDFGKVGTNDGNAVAKTDWTFKNGTWTREYLIGNDANNGRGGKDGDDYMMTVSATDIAGNKVSTDNLGQMYYGSEDGKVLVKDYNAYSKHDISDFRMDQTAPVVTVSFSNNSARNTRYFNAGRIATITVIDHNFNFNNGKVAGVLIEAEGKSDNVPLNAGWVSKGNDTYVKTVEFLADANCTFKISVTDMAGNTTTDADQKAVYGNSVAPHDFVIDLTNPTLGVTGTNQTPYPDACTPGFTGNDTNISSANGSAGYTVQLTRTVREHKNQDVTNLFANINPNMGADIISVVYANIPDAAENDGIYTLNVSVTDLAGNSSQTSNTFTVNRHGSFYVFNDDLAKLVNDKFVQKADGKYSITEYNASPLVAGSVKIEIYRDGQLEKTIKPTVGAAVLGASGLYEYTYDLPAENFAQDGRYSVSVSSEDEAKNMSDNTKLEESILEFTVDSVNPEIVIIKGLEKAIVNAEELEFTVNAVDTYGIKSIQIVVDGEVVKTFVPQEVYDQLKAEGKAMQQYEVMDENLDFTAAYTLYESNSKQSIEIVVTDMAGNSFTTASKDFAPVYDFHDSILVSTSFFARYIHNPVALVGTGIVIAGAVWLVLAKKKKTEDAAA